MKRPASVPLHINILTIFIVLVSILSGIVLYVNYESNSKAALDSADRLLNEISDKIVERTRRVYDPAFLLAEQASLLPDLSDKADFYGHPASPMLMKLLATEPNILSIFVGYDDGDFYMISHMGAAGDQARANYGANAATRYVIQTILHREDGRRVRLTKFLGADMRIVGSRLERDVAYDPRFRPWYAQAVGTDKTILTDLYVYASSKEVGLTVARRIDGRQTGVLGVDLTLAGISRFLAQQRVGEGSFIFLFNADGKLAAYPDETKVVKVSGTTMRDRRDSVVTANLEDLNEPAINLMYNSFRDGGAHPFLRRIFKADGNTYISRVVSMPPDYGVKRYLGIIIPLHEFTGPIVQAGRRSLIASLVAVLAFVPLIILVSRKISQPIRELAVEAEAIRRFELDGDIAIKSHITEIVDLTRAMRAMKTGLNSFSRFVPRDLVERMIKLRIVPELGGERRVLTLFFTDIADFTTLSERLPAEDVAHKISRYFKTMGGIIIEEQGTIDKYIGDAIMAFWNAPSTDEEHACRACIAALRCRNASRELNRNWIARGRDTLPTRFGLHTGETVVGYIGSSDRMDYTAMGTTVNIASRIEGLNKHFGTEILASEATMQACPNSFLFRSAGRVVPKGAHTPVTIYELRGALGDVAAAHPDLAASREERQYCAEWEAAFALYMGRQWKEAIAAIEELPALRGGDPVAEKYLELALIYAASPPGESWDGTETFHTK